MAEGLFIQIGADVSGALRDLPKVTKTLEQIEQQLADTLASGQDFAKSLDEIVKQGDITGGVINFLSKEISDFKKAFAAATTTEDIQKFGSALTILQDRQNKLIQSGLTAGRAIDEVGKHSKDTADDTKKLSASLEDILVSGKDFAKGLDDIVKEGNVAGGIINFLDKEITEFKKAFSSAITTEDIQKFGGAITILQDKQNQLIQSGLKAGKGIDEVEKHTSGGVVATQRLSTSLLGLNKIFDILPTELQHSVHGFDQIIQSFERVTHGTEGARDKILKFAGVLGEVGLGLAISIGIGLLVDLGKELFNTSSAFSEAEMSAAKFKSELEEVDNQVKLFAKNSDLATQIAKLQAQIKLGSGSAANILGDKSEIENNVKLIADIQFEIDGLRKSFNALVNAAPFQHLSEDAKKLFEESPLVAGLPSLFPSDLVNKLKDKDKAFLSQIEETNKKIHSLEAQREDIQNKNKLVELQIQLEQNKSTKSLLDSRLEIIKEFTAKFASIQLPLPFKKQELDLIPLGKVNDKTLRNGLEAAFKLFEPAWKSNIRALQGIIDKDTIPLFPELRVTPIINRTDLVRSIEEKFGEISKEVENAVNKGIFIVPIDFKIAPEGDGQALKLLEDRFIDLGKSIESVTGQRNAILNFHFNTNLLDEAKKLKVLDDVQQRIAEFASGTPLNIEVDANFKVNAKVDFKRLTTQLKQQISDALIGIQSNIATSFGEAIGRAISGIGNAKDVFGAVFDFLSEGIKSVGVALIKIGLLAEGIQKALAALSVQPELALALGIAFVALSQVLKNSFNAREKGGPVFGGHEYLVNEKGQEAFKDAQGNINMIPGGMQVFRPKMSGSIIPASLAKTIANQFRFPKLENGGIVNSPTFALIGEGLNPEIVAPLRDITAMVGLNNSQQNNRLTARLRGKDIYLSQSRQGRSNERLV